MASRAVCVWALVLVSLLAPGGRAEVLDTLEEVPDRPPVPEKEECDPSIAYTVRWASSTQRIYLEHSEETAGTRGGCATLTSVLAALTTSDTPLVHVDPDNHIWQLNSDLYVQDGITLILHGSSIGGDVDELRFFSAPDPDPELSQYFNIRGYGGNLDISDTKIMGWNGSGPQEDYENGRSYISCVSEVSRGPQDCTKSDPVQGECRMDVINSEISYLGWGDSESYGLVWKVRGLCLEDAANPPLSNMDLFDDVQVTGNMLNSNIHHLYYGMYSYGQQGGLFQHNQMHDNIGYGFDPHDDSDFLQIDYNEVWGNGNHNIIASQRCNGISIQNNHVYDGGNAGIMLHRNSDNGVIRGNWLHDNVDAGVALFESHNARVLRNTMERNTFGIRLSVGSRDNLMKKNVMKDSVRYHLYTYEGSDLPEVVDTGRPQNNKFTKNVVSGVGESAIKLREADGTIITNNAFTDVELFSFSESTDTIWKLNGPLPDGVVFEHDDDCFNEASWAGAGPTC